jgi:hypothetical protein
MKISEVKIIEEGFFSDVADTFAPDRYREQDPEKKQAGIQRLFLKDFISDFKVDFNNNIKAGVIDPNLQSTQPNSTQEKPPGIKSSSGFTEKAISNLKPRVDRMFATRQIRNRTHLGAWLNKTYPATWKNTKDKASVLKKLMPTRITNEGYDLFLNKVSESIINEQQQTPINNWIVKWFNAYMQGLSWQQERSTVEKIATEIANSYNQNKSLKGLDQLANLAWQITGNSKKSPRGFDKGSTSSINSPGSITSKDISRDPDKTQEFVDKGLTTQEREILKKALEKAKP